MRIDGQICSAVYMIFGTRDLFVTINRQAVAKMAGGILDMRQRRRKAVAACAGFLSTIPFRPNRRRAVAATQCGAVAISDTAGSTAIPSRLDAFLFRNAPENNTRG